MRLTRWPVLVGLLVALSLRPVPASAAVAFLWTFPGDCGGQSTLQGCIDFANSGDTIQIATNSIVENITITKSLDMHAADGFDPVIAGAGYVHGSSGAIVVSLEDLGFGDGLVAVFDGGSGHSLFLTRLNVGNAQSTGAGLVVDAFVPASAEVLGGSFSTHGNEGFPIGAAADPGSDLTLQIIGVSVSGRENPDGAQGIELQANGGATLHAGLFDNVVTHTGRCNCGAADGVRVRSNDDAKVHVRLVGNTIDNAHTAGLEISNDVTESGSVQAKVFDNIFTNSGKALSLSSAVPSTLTFSAGHNDFFGNTFPDELEGHSLGSGNLRMNPRYVDRSLDDFHLAADSPLIDAGIACSPGGVENLDAAGNGRLAGPSVDMGAFERGATAPTGVALLGGGGADQLTGTSGADILCGYGGQDSLSGEDGNDYLDGGPGADALVGGAGADSLHGRGGADTMGGLGGADRLFGEAGPDQAVGGVGPDVISGGAGDDPCLSSHDGVKGNDSIAGGPGSDGFLSDQGDQVQGVEHPAICS